MDKNSLVVNDPEIEARVVAALSKAQLPVSAVDWTWVPQQEASRLVVVTSLYDTKGPREAYARILEALSVAGVYQSLPISNLVVMSPTDPVAQELRAISEGTIHISNLGDKHRPCYSVIFAPYRGKGGAIPSARFNDVSPLREFLEKRLGIPPYLAEQSLAELAHRGSSSIFHVQLSLRKAKKLNLAA